MEIISMVSVSENGIIGKNGQLPWRPIPEDLRRFREQTKGHAVIMGRGTWESLPTKPLPKRRNIIVSNTATWHTIPNPEVDVASSIDGALFYFANSKHNYEKAFLIGGERIYREGLQYCDTVLLTRVHEHVDYGPDDVVARFDIDLEQWTIVQGFGWTNDGRASFYQYTRVK